MKRHLRLLLCMVLGLCLLLPAALAENTTVALKADSGYVRQMITVGDAVYLLVNDYGKEDLGLCLYRWKVGEKEATRLATKLAQIYDGMDEDALQAMRDDGQDVDHAPGFLTTDGERLLGVNNATGLVFAIVPGEDGVTYQDVVTMSDRKLFVHEEMDFSYFMTPNNSLVLDNVMLCLLNEYTDNVGQVYKLVRVDLTTGETTVSAVQHVNEISFYKDGKALLLVRDEKNQYDEEKLRYKPFDLMEYNAAEDTAKAIGQVDLDTYGFDWIWSEELQAPVWSSNGRIWALTEDLTTKKQVGFSLNSGYQRTVVGSQLVDLISSEGMTLGLHDLSLNFNPDEYLNTYSVYNSNAQLLFMSRYPDVPVYSADDYYPDLESLAQAMVTGSDSLDVLQMNLKYSQFDTMLRKGYCADLSASSIITDAVNRMYPVFQEAVKDKNGNICAVPVQAYSNGWYVNEDVMEEVGLTREDLPTNYVELCEFVTRWNNEFAEEYDEYTVFSTSGADYMKGNLFDYILTDYINYCQATSGSIRFDTPIFRELIAAIDAVECKDIRPTVQSFSADDYLWRTSLLDYGASVVGNFDESGQKRLLPLSLTADTEVVNNVELWVMFINPRSKNLNTALRYLECVVESLESSNDAYVLYTDKTEPKLNDYYDRAIASIEENIAEIEKMLENADPSEKRMWEESLQNSQEWLEEYKNEYYYDIGPNAITYYREQVVPTIAVGYQTFLSASDAKSGTAELNSLVKRYKVGQITIDQFIKEADNKLYMMEMEDQ